MADNPQPSEDGQIKLSGFTFIATALFVATSNFIAIMNMSIANVALPTIAGNLGISYTEGTWVITFYAVAEAIAVPLTGWLAARFGSIRLFIAAMFMFGMASILCGLSGSLPMLVFARMLQGMSGGLLMPLSQTLLLRLFPKEKAASATALWSVTTLVAPVVGPILGGYLCEYYTWSWAFFINAPIAFLGAAAVAKVLWRQKEKLARLPIDKVGLGLLVLWVGSLQVMLDEGKNKDWFSSNEICILAVVAAVGFVSFLIWEFTERHPVVDLRVYRHRGFTAGAFTLSVAFGAIFGINVFVPQWLQVNMGYTSTWAGKSVAWLGVLGVVFAPITAKFLGKIDSRLLASLGTGWMGLMTVWLMMGNTDMGFWDVALPFLFMGIGLPLLVVAVNALSLSSVDPNELDSAAGLLNFTRTLAGAIATSLTTTAWENAMKVNRAELTSVSDTVQGLAVMHAHGAPTELSRGVMDLVVQGQSVMLATNNVLAMLAGVFFVATLCIWFAPKLTHLADISKAH